MTNTNEVVTQQATVKPTKRGIRIWIEGKRLSNAGFIRGAAYNRALKNGIISYRLDDTGSLNVAGRTRNNKDVSIIDLSVQKLDGFQANDKIIVLYSFGLISIMKAQL